MKIFNNYTLIVLSVLALFLVGCSGTQVDPNFPNQPDNNIVSGDNPTEEPSNPSTGLFSPKYNGAVLAGEKAPYIEFNTEDYQKATEDGKVILLYFYSLQSAPSIADQNAVYDAFDEMVNPNIIGFRVNFDDDSTSAAEISLASELSVRIARTKLILKDGKVVQRSTSSDWNANDYIRQLTQYLD